MLDAVAARGSVKRILCVAGPGDVAGSYKYWRDDQDDPSISAVSYSQQVFELAERLGAELWMVTEHALPNDLPDGPVRFIHLPRPKGRSLGYHVSDFRYVMKVLTLTRQHRIDTLIIQRMLRNFWPLARFPKAGRRLIFSLHNAIHDDRATSLMDRLYFAGKRHALKAAQGVLAVGPPLARQIEDQIGTGQKVHPHTPQYSKAALQVGDHAAERDPKKIIYAGRVEDNKGVFDLLEAFEAIAPKHEGAKLVFLGKGGALEALRQRAAASVHADAIEVPGAVPGQDVIGRIAASAVLVCPTSARFREGLAKTPLEAALNSIPSIMTTVVPAKDMIGEGGVIIPPDDPKALATALDDLLSDPARIERMGQAARAAVIAAVADPSKSFGVKLLELIDQSSHS